MTDTTFRLSRDDADRLADLMACVEGGVFADVDGPQRALAGRVLDALTTVPLVFDLSGGEPGPVLSPEARIRLTIEDVAGDGWDGVHPARNFYWSDAPQVASLEVLSTG